MSKINNYLTKNILNINEKNIWLNKYFKQIFLEGLKNDGISKNIINQIEMIFEENKPLSGEILIEFIEQKIDREKLKNDSELVKLKNKLRIIFENNSKCYLRETPEKVRVVQWPNNPAYKINDKANYFDIFTDNFLREAKPIITNKTPIGSLGSCFALRIAHQLQNSGYNYVLEEDDLPKDLPIEKISETSYRMSPARTGTLWNVPSMRQVIERAFGEKKFEKIVIKNKNHLIDPFRTISTTANKKEYENDYINHNKALFRAFKKCEVMILTLGLTEAWKFAHSEDYTSVSPWKIDPLILRQKQLSVEDNLLELEKLLDVYKRHKPDIKLIISVSPVPFNKTFSTKDHVVVANSYSKAVLRVAAEMFASRHPENVFYFPSYEVVMYGTKNPWESDMRHVSSEAVSRVMTLFQKMFLLDQKPLKLLNHSEPPPPQKQFFKSWMRFLAGPTLPILRKLKNKILQ